MDLSLAHRNGRAAVWLVLPLVLGACSSDGGDSTHHADGGGGETSGSGGGNSSESGGTASGGSSDGQAGALATGGQATGGDASGGQTMGGAATGGAATGGEATGGTATGGAATGGAATGGAATGGGGNVIPATCETSEPVSDVEVVGTTDGCGTPTGTFGLSTSTDYYTVDTGAGLVFKVRRTDPANNTQSAGDIASLVYKGVEYQEQTRGSQIGVGLGSGTVTATKSGNAIKITVTATDGDLTHYYMAQNGCSNIYMGTHFKSEPSLGNVRYIARILRSALPNGPTPSDLNGTTGAIEASDVFGLANGQTRSKHYSNHRQMDWTYTGATGAGVGIWMVKGNEEGMSGGPFYRNLINQGGSTNQEIYALINYGEAQTEAFRTSVLSTYTLMFTNGSKPKPPDLSFQSSLGLIDYVPKAARGNALGVGIAGRDACHQYVVGFANEKAQYWAVAAKDGSFSRYGMIPGTYAMTVYQGEYAVWKGEVTVNAGASTALHTITIADDPNKIPVIWRIGEWDGTPNEFLNGPKLTSMHPQDVRMHAWSPVTYVVADDTPADFPSVQFRGANSPTTIKFNLTAEQAAAAHKLKIGITIAYNNGRPLATINGHALATPAASSQPKTRSLTVGTYRGNNTTFAWDVPAADFVEGENTLTLTPVSGNADLGAWLSASYSYDAIQLEE